MQSGKMLIVVWPEASAYNATYPLAFWRLGIPYVLANPNLSSMRNLEITSVFSYLHPLRGRPLLNRLLCAGAWFAFRNFGAFSYRYRGVVQPRPSGVLARVRDAGIAAGHFFHNVLEPFSMPVYHRALQMARHDGVAVRWETAGTGSRGRVGVWPAPFCSSLTGGRCCSRSPLLRGADDHLSLRRRSAWNHQLCG